MDLVDFTSTSSESVAAESIQAEGDPAETRKVLDYFKDDVEQ